jgi:hypothetical protein
MYWQSWLVLPQKAYESLGALGERVLGFAYANLDLPHDHPWTDQPEPNFPVKVRGATLARALRRRALDKAPWPFERPTGVPRPTCLVRSQRCRPRRGRRMRTRAPTRPHGFLHRAV